MDMTPGSEQLREEDLPAGWLQWYRLARSALGYSHAEAVQYANVRTVEDGNRARGRRPAA